MNGANRPLSPHLQIYRPQLTSVLSITHRLTGVALAFGTILLVWWIIAAATGEEYFGLVQAIMSSWYGLVILVGFSWAIFYHLCNGIRHLFWDAGYGFDLDIAYKSGWATVVGSFILTGFAWAIGILV